MWTGEAVNHTKGKEELWNILISEHPNILKVPGTRYMYIKRGSPQEEKPVDDSHGMEKLGGGGIICDTLQR